MYYLLLHYACTTYVLRMYYDCTELVLRVVLKDCMSYACTKIVY
jgi:hypothetical protein